MPLSGYEYGDFRKDGAEEETRTPTAYKATAPSTLRVYQFHHLGREREGPAFGPNYSQRLSSLSTAPVAPDFGRSNTMFFPS